MLLLLMTIGCAYEYWGYSFNSANCVDGNISISDPPTNYSCDAASILLSTNASVVIGPPASSLASSNFTLFTTVQNENASPDVTISLFENVMLLPRKTSASRS